MAKAASPLETPMMRQYLEVKAERPDCLLLMRMGDFFECFLEDAKTLARVCGVALTARNKDADEPIPMAGVPHHSLAQHLPRLLAAGIRVAVMDQLEDPKEAAKEGRSLVRRGLTRVLTAGTLLDEEALSGTAVNNLVALTALDGLVGVAALDVSTGRFTVEEAQGQAQLALALARLQPAEVVLPEAWRDDEATAGILARLCAPSAAPVISALPAYAWKAADARRHLAGHFQVGSLDAFGLGAGDDHLATAAAAALRYAAGAVAPGSDANPLAHVRGLSRLHVGGHLVLDATCRRNLDLLRNSRDGGRAGTLLAAIDRTRTAPGARLLADWLSRPLAAVGPIAERHDAVEALVRADGPRADLRDALGEVYDLERLLARLATGRANARDLVHLARSLRGCQRASAALARVELPPLLARAQQALNPDPELVETIEATLVEDPPLAISDGGLVRDGVDQELDDLRVIRRDAGEWLAKYQQREAEACGLPRLKVGYNKVFGYYIEISKANGEKVPAHFIRKQTLVGAERYITPELKDYEDKALGAEDRIRAKELAMFTALRSRAEASLGGLMRCAEAMALCDVGAGLAEIARRGGWCRPVIDDSCALELTAARHPVVEEVVGSGNFVANDARLAPLSSRGGGGGGWGYGPAGTAPTSDPATPTPDPRPLTPRLAIITGPNMAGKSTYIRQVALAVILAQAGSFVPAQAARIGLVDRVFTRVGAGDELARNLSTFMVEMAETAAILHHATRRSLVVLDEVGRGTSTFDGVSLAWAITEHLHDRVGCRCLFATHYHELTDLAADRPGIGNLTVAVAEQDEDVVFLHRIVAGAATKSYGIHVARLAGVPGSVVARAKEVLSTLEQLNVSLTERERPAVRAPSPQQGAVQLTLFQAVESPTLNRLKAADLDALTPRQAQDLLYELQARARKE